jgi:molybdopterin converting factor subunit 1
VVEYRAVQIRVKVLYFGQARDAAGTGWEYVSIPNASPVRTLVGESMKAHQRLRELSVAMRIAVNEEIAGDDHRLTDGDVVAFLPPVAGG